MCCAQLQDAWVGTNQAVKTQGQCRGSFLCLWTVPCTLDAKTILLQIDEPLAAPFLNVVMLTHTYSFILSILSFQINLHTSHKRWCSHSSVSGCELSIPGHGGCNLTGGLTLVNPLLGVLRMMMWAVDPPWWFHFLRASSRSQIEKLWGYYKVKGWLTLNMMTIPSGHFHFLKRLIPRGSSWGQRRLWSK